MSHYKHITVGSQEYIIQSYIKGERANVVTKDTRLSFILCLKSLSVLGTYGKEDVSWKTNASKINVKNIKDSLDEYFEK